MNQKQLKLMESYQHTINSNLFTSAKQSKEQVSNMGMTKDQMYNMIFNQLCILSGWYGINGPKDFPLPLDMFIYLYGKSVDKASDTYQQFVEPFTKYDNYELKSLLNNICDALLNINDSTDVVAKTMFVAICLLIDKNTGTEDDLDMLLMYLMLVVEVDNNGTNPEGVNQSFMLWTASAIYLDFEERYARICSMLIRNAENES